MIHVLNAYEDGTLLGADENGTLYTGKPIQVGPHELTVTTTVAKDGSSYARTTTFRDTVVGHSEVTKEGFLENPAIQIKITGGADPDELWAKELAIEQHVDDGLRYNVIDWEMK